MISAESLKIRIREEFSEVPFPSHCGLHAAMAKDDWVDDVTVLKEITQSDDYIGNWWNVPIKHLTQCMMALSYLDGSGMEFYLPAYMTALIETPHMFDNSVRSSSWQVISAMLPDDDEPEMKQYFIEQFTKIDGKKRRVCQEFLSYVANCSAYDEHARQIANEALSKEFWSIESEQFTGGDAKNEGAS